MSTITQRLYRPRDAQEAESQCFELIQRGRIPLDEALGEPYYSCWCAAARHHLHTYAIHCEGEVINWHTILTPDAASAQEWMAQRHAFLRALRVGGVQTSLATWVARYEEKEAYQEGYQEYLESSRQLHHIHRETITFADWLFAAHLYERVLQGEGPAAL